MMALVREWLLGITGAAILSAVAEALMPEGGVKRAGRLVCGLVLLLAILRPLEGANLTNLWTGLRYDSDRTARAAEELEKEADSRMKTIIEEKLAAYSMDKAAGLGLDCRVEVRCRQEDGIFLPESVRITGESSRAFEELLTRELGLPRDAVTVREGEP